MLRAFLLLLVTTVLIVGAAWYMMQESKNQQAEAEKQERVEKGFLTTRQEFNDKMEEYKRRKDEVEVQIERFRKRQEQATQELREMGVKTAQDLETNTEARRKYDSIRQDMEDIKKLEGDAGLFADAISAIQAGLDELDRKDLLENVGVDDSTYAQLRTVVKDLDDRLSKPMSALDKIETQDTLDMILGSGEGDDQSSR